ncbi:MAG TPA: BTAD domain-containing putative transcriptional regulator [Amycolatopsis sp.]|nr:BTAD domain-containing putative transcriptional regulator [Amycolatopsis sp.]
MFAPPEHRGRFEFTLLDGVAATRDYRQIVLGPPQRRAVLMALLLRAGRVVGVDQLVDSVWDDAPAQPSAALQVHVSSLRRALEPECAPRERRGVIRSVGRGYLIEPGDIGVDAFRFQELLETAAWARQQGDLVAATTALRTALAWFRTDGLLGVPGPFCSWQREKLAEQRLTAQEDLVELDMLLRPGEKLAHDLTALLVSNPHRERLHAVHMRLLRHNGRRADALAAYANARRILVGDLGIEPGEQLRQLHQQILAGDTSGPVNAPRIVVVPHPAAEAGEAGRLPQQPVLLGRTDAVAEVAEALTTADSGERVVVLHGIPGMGKTAVAIAAAASLADHFPGGQYFLSADADEEEQRAVLSRAGGARRSLLVLDDASSISQVRVALPAEPGSALLITSRYRGRLLPFARRIELRPLTAFDSRELFCRALGRWRLDSEPRAVDRLVALAGGVAGLLLSFAELLSRRPSWSLGDYVEHLSDRSGGSDWSIGMHLRPLFERSYAELDPLLAKALRSAAGQQDEPVTTASVAARIGLPVARVELLLEELVDRSLLDSQGPARYSVQPLIRQFAVDRTAQLKDDPDQPRSRDRRVVRGGRGLNRTTIHDGRSLSLTGKWKVL